MLSHFDNSLHVSIDISSPVLKRVKVVWNTNCFTLDRFFEKIYLYWSLVSLSSSKRKDTSAQTLRPKVQIVPHDFWKSGHSVPAKTLNECLHRLHFWQTFCQYPCFISKMWQKTFNFWQWYSFNCFVINHSARQGWQFSGCSCCSSQFFSWSPTFLPCDIPIVSNSTLLIFHHHWWPTSSQWRRRISSYSAKFLLDSPLAWFHFSSNVNFAIFLLILQHCDPNDFTLDHFALTVSEFQQGFDFNRFHAEKPNDDLLQL